jgi:hypothetical protein
MSYQPLLVPPHTLAIEVLDGDVLRLKPRLEAAVVDA